MSTATEPGTRYPARATEFARRLYEAGRTVPQVREALALRGFFPTLTTIRYWCEPEIKNARNLRRRAYGPSSQAPAERAWWVKLRRLRELRDAGLSFSSIAKVARVDFGLEIETEQVRSILNGKVSQRTVRRLMEAA